MKKTYIIPELVLVRVQTESIIALSRVEGQAQSTDDNGVSMGTKSNDWDIWDD